MTTEEEREAKLARLPKWAQRDIERLEANARYWREKANAGPADSNTYISNFEDSKPLGDSPMIRFWLAKPGDGGEYIDAHVDVSRGRMVLELSSGVSLSIEPRSSNHAVVIAEPY